MAMTLAEAAKYSNDVIKAGVLDTIVQESALLRVMPFIEVLGNGLTYNRENAMATASWYDVGGTWTESTPTVTQVTATLNILGGDADIDNFLAKTRGNVQDLTAAVLMGKSKAVAYQFEDSFIYGTGVAPIISGLHATIPAGQRISIGSGAIPAALSLSQMDAMIDLVRPGKPDVIMMSRRTRRGLSSYGRALTSPVSYGVDEFGRSVSFYNGIPIVVSDFIVDTETIASGVYSAKTGGASTSVFAMRFDEQAGLVGIQATDGIMVEDVGSLETKDARRWRVKWYCNYALFSTAAIAKIDGISSAAVVA